MQSAKSGSVGNVLKTAVFVAVLLAGVSAFAQTLYNETVIRYFGSQLPDGYEPSGNGFVFDKAGNLYATVVRSVGGLGPGYGGGAVVELSPQGGGLWEETVLYIFNPQGTGFNGYNPTGPLAIDSKGNLYGTTWLGGSGGCTDNRGNPTGCGTVYELSPGAGGIWTATEIYSFQGSGFPAGGGSFTDGAWPMTGVTPASASATVLYGTTTYGGATGAGTVYKLTYTKPTKTNKGGWSKTILYNFPGPASDPGGPFPQNGALLLKSGNLYGTTGAGGTFEGGTVYELTPGASGWNENVLYNFCSLANCADGNQPMYGSPAMDSKGNLYGTTYGGGTAGEYGYGTAWELVYSSATKTYTEKTLYSFGSQATDGINPSWGIVPYKNKWYGTTGSSPAVVWPNQNGTVFELSYSAKTGWKETNIWEFTGLDQESVDVALPGYNQLVVDKLGNLYGMGAWCPCDEGSGSGGVFELSPE